MTSEAQAPRWLKPAAAAALLLAFAILAWRFWRFWSEAARAAVFFDELDYGEGIVWQQAEWLFTPRAYGPIDVWPAIVYHYTPFYHLMTRLVSALGIDMLVAGRIVSLGATAAIALCAGGIAAQAAEPATSLRARWIMAAGAGLSVFCVWPLILWGPMMRVDMLAIALGFAGVLAGIAALRRPWLIHVAALCFVLAVYTKQTQIAAPAALFLVLLAVRPRLALRGIVSTIILGLIALAALVWATDGGFVRHVFLYNINRLELWRLRWMRDALSVHCLFLLVALRMAWPRFRIFRDRLKAGGRAAIPVADIAWLVAIAYFVLAWLTAFTIAKSGSNVNYLIEWLCALCILVGLALNDAARAASGDVPTARNGSQRFFFAIVIPLVVAVQGWMLKPPSNAPTWRPGRVPQLERLGELVGAARKPVISDNMVVLLRTGKIVPWEPAIFAELAHAGIWAEQPFVDRIRRGEFAYFITVGKRGQRLYNSRYNPAVAEAIDAAYPQIVVIAGYQVHVAPGTPEAAAAERLRDE